MSDFKSWRLDLDTVSKLPAGVSLDPPGFDSATAKDPSSSGRTAKKVDAASLRRREQAMMARAMAPGKNVAFMCFMMWMVGNGIQLFSIIFTITGITQPITAMLGAAKQFPYDPEIKVDVWKPRLVYCAVHAAQLLFALNKLAAMGLLPTHASDWLAGLPAPETVERSYPAV